MVYSISTISTCALLLQDFIPLLGLTCVVAVSCFCRIGAPWMGAAGHDKPPPDLTTTRRVFVGVWVHDPIIWRVLFV